MGGGTDETTWTLSIADDSLTHVVLGPGFGATEGTELALTKVDDTHYKVSGDYGTHAAQLGRRYVKDVELSRPYVRNQIGGAIIDSNIILNKLVVNHQNSGGYAVLVETVGQSDRTYTFAPVDGSVAEVEGNFEVFPMGISRDTTLHVRNASAVPSVISTIEYIITHNARAL